MSKKSDAGKKSDFSKLIKNAMAKFKGGKAGIVGGKWTSSVFMPIYSIAHQRQVGFDAIPYYPQKKFDDLEIPAALTIGDRMQWVLHVVNFAAGDIDDRWLFMDISPDTVMTHGEGEIEFLKQLLEHAGVAPTQVVVTLKEKEIERNHNLGEVMEALNGIGCLTCFDGFCDGPMEPDRIWRHEPKLVTLECDMLENALTHVRAKRMLRRMVALIHAGGAGVVFKGVENQEEIVLAIQVDADFVQGPFLGKAESPPRRTGVSQGDVDFPEINKTWFKLHNNKERSMLNEITFCTGEFYNCAWALQDGESLDVAGAALLDLPRVERIYLLNKKGRELGSSLFCQEHPAVSDPNFKPLEDFNNATFSRRSHFQKALQFPGKLRTSIPYFSIASFNVCITLSMSVQLDGKTCVLCCDLKWDRDVIADF